MGICEKCNTERYSLKSKLLSSESKNELDYYMGLSLHADADYHKIRCFCDWRDCSQELKNDYNSVDEKLKV